MALSSNLAPSCTAIASHEEPPGEQGDPTSLNDLDYAGGPTHTYTPYVSFEPATPHASDWVGLHSSTARRWKRIEFQAGDTYSDGGYWTSAITVESSNDGSSWTAVTGLIISSLDAPGGSVGTTPNGYPYDATANSFKNYRLDFDEPGSATTYIRVRGNTANTAGFVAVNELFAFEELTVGIAAPGYGAATGFGTASVGIVGVISAPSLATTTGFGAAIVSQPGENIAAGGTAIASYSAAPGDGPQPSLMNNGSYLGVPGFDYAPFETYQVAVPHAEDWVGFQFPANQYFSKLEWQTGGDWYTASGFWSSNIVVEFWDGAAWSVQATNLTIAEITGPNGTLTGNPYPYSLAANGFKWYRATFDYANPPRSKIRIRGNVSGEGFIGITELFAYTTTSAPADAAIVAPSLAAPTGFGTAVVGLGVAGPSLAAVAAFGVATLNSPNQVSCVGLAAKAAFGGAAITLGISAPSLAPAAHFGAVVLSSGLVNAPSFVLRAAFGTAVVAVDLHAPLVGGTVGYGTARVDHTFSIGAPSLAAVAAFGPADVRLVISAPSYTARAYFGDTGLAGQSWIIGPAYRALAGFGTTLVAADSPISAPSLAARAAFGLARVRTGLSIAPSSMLATAAFGTASLGVTARVSPAGYRTNAGFGPATLTTVVAAPGKAAVARFGTTTVAPAIAATSCLATASFGAASVGLQLLAPSVRCAAGFGNTGVGIAPRQWIVCGGYRALLSSGQASLAVGLALSAPSLVAKTAFGMPMLTIGVSCTSLGAHASFGGASLSVSPLDIAAPSFAGRAHFGAARVRGGNQFGAPIIAPTYSPIPIEVDI